MAMPVTMPVMAMTVTVPVMAMPGKRGHWKQHSSRDCANERELAKHFGSPCCVKDADRSRR
jgi:hypothetical protein